MTIPRFQVRAAVERQSSRPCDQGCGRELTIAGGNAALYVGHGAQRLMVRTATFLILVQRQDKKEIFRCGGVKRKKSELVGGGLSEDWLDTHTHSHVTD